MSKPTALKSNYNISFHIQILTLVMNERREMELENKALEVQ